MNKKLKVLFAGESIYVQKLIYKGFDNFSIGSYVEHAEHYLNALRNNGIEVDYIPTNKVGEEFPWTLEELKNYDAVVVSDVEGNYEI
ncbi:MAG: glutamine amidotransferase [Candidatus Humimicrobiaceae bacterium]